MLWQIEPSSRACLSPEDWSVFLAEQGMSVAQRGRLGDILLVQSSSMPSSLVGAREIGLDLGHELSAGRGAVGERR